MSYQVKEIFYTLQGEGANAGRPAVFCRFAGCNLWSGREEDRTAAVCRFCDTDFVGIDGTLGGKFADAHALAARIAAQWPSPVHDHRMVVLTGGEPLLRAECAKRRDARGLIVGCVHSLSPVKTGSRQRGALPCRARPFAFAVSASPAAA